MSQRARIIVRSDTPVAQLAAGTAFPLEFAEYEDTLLADGWRVGWLADWPDLMIDVLAAFAAETGAPVLLAEGMPIDEFALAVLHLPGVRPGDPPVTFNCWLGADAAEDAGNDLHDYDYISTLALAGVWARAAGLVPDTTTLAVVLAEQDGLASEYITLFLDGLGLRGLPGAPTLRARYGLMAVSDWEVADDANLFVCAGALAASLA